MAEAKSVEERSPQANYQRRQHEIGMCPRCGVERLDFNNRTGKPFSKGPICRRKWNELQKELMRVRRAGD